MAKKTNKEVTVTWNGGSRVYSEELHGKEYKELAQEFATKKGGTVSSEEVEA